MILEFAGNIAGRLSTFGPRQAVDFIAVFGILWLGLTAILLIVMPILRDLRKRGMSDPAAPRAQGGLLANPKAAAIIGVLLALPFVTILSLLWLGIEPSFGPLDPLLRNADPDRPDVAGTLIVVGSFLMCLLGGLIIREPIIRTLRSCGRLLAHPFHLALAVVIVSFMATLVIGIVVDQYPCWIGTPNCD